MEFVVGLGTAAVVVFYWLRGSLLGALFLQFGYLAIGGALALEDSLGSLAIVCAAIWAPCAWRLLYHREVAKVATAKAERDAVADGWRRYFEKNGIVATGFAAPLPARRPAPTADLTVLPPDLPARIDCSRFTSVGLRMMLPTHTEV